MAEDDILFVNGPIIKYVRQQCLCKNSLCINDSVFGEARMTENFKWIVPVTGSVDVCNRCKTPYEVWYDTSNIVRVTNIGDEK